MDEGSEMESMLILIIDEIAKKQAELNMLKWVEQQARNFIEQTENE